MICLSILFLGSLHHLITMIVGMVYGFYAFFKRVCCNSNKVEPQSAKEEDMLEPRAVPDISDKDPSIKGIMREQD